MFDLMKAVEDKTNLAGTNRLEVLMFSLDEKSHTKQTEVFGINVFKVRELMAVPEIMKLPLAPRFLEGVANVRGHSVPVIDLKRYCGVDDEAPPRIMVMTEYNDRVQGFLVNDVDNIIQLAWSEIKEPPRMVAEQHGNILTAISRLEDGRMLLILDVEKVLSEVLNIQKNGAVYEEVIESHRENCHAFFADDSAVARAQLSSILGRMGVTFEFECNGLKAWNALKAKADEAEADGVSLKERIQIIITDVEMPEMDGYVLTKHIKDDKRFTGIPVIMHSSLSADGNIRMGKKMGVDRYVPKLRPKELSETISELLEVDLRLEA